MRKHLKQTRIEWALLGVIAIACGVLSFLQYRWTGELSRAEPVLLRAGLSDQVRRLVQAFNDEIQENCAALVPTSIEIEEQGSVEAHNSRYEAWVHSHDAALFSRIGIALPSEGTLGLYDISKSGESQYAKWPSEWESLRTQMLARTKGEGRPPNAPADSITLETPIFSRVKAKSGFPTEIEWMIFDVSPAYLRTRLLPKLIAEYLNPSDAIYEVSVNWGGPGGKVVFSTRVDGAAVTSRSDASAGIFLANVGTPPITMAAPDRGRERSRLRENTPRWTIAVRHRAGSLDAAVARARTRNLSASLLVVALLGGTALALVRSTRRSRRLSEMQFRFAAGVSHDLRTPLTAIRGAAFNLVEGIVIEPTAVHQYLKLILRNSEELTRMIENVLAFSASLHREAAPRSETCAIGEMLQNAVASMHQEIEEAGCQLEMSVAPALPRIEGDHSAVELVFRNLIGNALRHGAGGKWIGVSAAATGNGVEVRVCDHGPGVPEGERDRIFEPFYRGEQSRAHRIYGTGLGLSLVKATIEQHKGTIQVHDSPGGGAQFTVRLPAMSEAA